MTKPKGVTVQKAKKEMPYGKYIFSDGSQILFNRYYEPITQKDAADMESLKLKIEGAKKQWFYNDSNPPWLNQETLQKCQIMLKAIDVK